MEASAHIPGMTIAHKPVGLTLAVLWTRFSPCEEDACTSLHFLSPLVSSWYSCQLGRVETEQAGSCITGSSRSLPEHSPGLSRCSEIQPSVGTARRPLWASPCATCGPQPGDRHQAVAVLCPCSLHERQLWVTHRCGFSDICTSLFPPEIFPWKISFFFHPGHSAAERCKCLSHQLWHSKNCCCFPSSVASIVEPFCSFSQQTENCFWPRAEDRRFKCKTS